MVPLAHATSEGSDEPAHPHNLARGINAHIRGGGGGGVGGEKGLNCFSREVLTSFSSRKQMATYDFHGEVRTPCPPVSAHIRASNSLNSHFFFFFLFCWAWSIHKTSANYVS